MEVKNVLEQLYNGEIFPAEQYAPKGEEYRKIYQGNYNHYDDFIEVLAKLEPPPDKRFIEIMDEQLDVIPYEFSEMFIDGFKLGQRWWQRFSGTSRRTGTGKGRRFDVAAAFFGLLINWKLFKCYHLA